jgi:hypothetical protein
MKRTAVTDAFRLGYPGLAGRFRSPQSGRPAREAYRAATSGSQGDQESVQRLRWRVWRGQDVQGGEEISGENSVSQAPRPRADWQKRAICAHTFLSSRLSPLSDHGRPFSGMSHSHVDTLYDGRH